MANNFSTNKEEFIALLPNEDNSNESRRFKIKNRDGVILQFVKRVVNSWKNLTWTCYYCNHNFNDFLTYKSHQDHLHKIINFNDAYYQCVDCDEQPFGYAAFLNHVRRIHYNELKLCCDVCSEILHDYAQLSSHRNEHNETSNNYPAIYHCIHCEIVHSSERELNSHIKMSHNLLHSAENIDLTFSDVKEEHTEALFSPETLEEDSSFTGSIQCKDEFNETEQSFQFGKCVTNFVSDTDLMVTNEATNVSCSSTNNLCNSEIREKIQNGQFRIVNKRGRSKVWEMFGKVYNDADQQLPNIVACKTCRNAYKYNERSTSNLVKHKCFRISSSLIEKYEVDEESKRQAVNIFTQWTIENCRPLKIVCDSGLKKLAQFFVEIGIKSGPNIDVNTLLPHPTSISRNIESHFKKCVDEMKRELVSVKDIGFGLTAGLWKDNYLKKSFLAVNIHFVIQGALKTLLLGFQSMEYENTQSKILENVNKLLSEFDCSLNKKAIIVTAEETNMVAAFQSFNHIFCVNQLIHDTLEKSLKSIPEIVELCQACSKVVKYFEASSANNILKHSLKSFSFTSWNSVYYMLSSIEKNWSEVVKIFQKQAELHNIIEEINLNNLTKVIRVLQPFEEISRLLEGEKNPTMNITYAHICLLKKKCTSETADLEFIKNFKNILSTHIQKIIFENLTIFHKVGLFLYPPANKLLQFSEIEKAQIIEECKCQMMIYDDILSNEIIENTPKRASSSIYSEALNDFVCLPNKIELNERVLNEIHLYSSFSVAFYDDFDVLKWWDLHKKEFPLLYKISCKVLATPSSSAASERVFSSARNLISEQGAQICSDDLTIGKIMFLHCNMNKMKFEED